MQGVEGEREDEGTDQHEEEGTDQCYAAGESKTTADDSSGDARDRHWNGEAIDHLIRQHEVKRGREVGAQIDDLGGGSGGKKVGAKHAAQGKDREGAWAGHE